MDDKKKDTIHIDELLSNLNELSEEMLKSSEPSIEEKEKRNKSISETKPGE